MTAERLANVLLGILILLIISCIIIVIVAVRYIKKLKAINKIENLARDEIIKSIDPDKFITKTRDNSVESSQP